ncbi:MAG: membrane protein insertase YidC [Kiritimatiellae bacterium]|nr:membrane protein insertase YidC [Kiritimatiellia bacterium]
MNKTEKIICILLGGVLAWYLFTQKPAQRQSAAEVEPAAAKQEAPAPQSAAPAAHDAVASAPPKAADAVEAAVEALPTVPEKIYTLENDDLKLDVSSWGAVVKKAVLKKYARDEGELGEKNPPVEFSFASSPLGALGGKIQPFDLESQSSNTLSFASGGVKRKVTLGENYLVTFEDSIPGSSKTTLSLGEMKMGASKNDLLSVDSWLLDDKGGKVIHHCEGDSPLKGYLAGGVAGGCSGSKNAAGLPDSATIAYPGRQTWVALKNRFFVTALVSTTAINNGFTANVGRDLTSSVYRPDCVSARVSIDATGLDTIKSIFFVGPKKQSLLWDLGMKDVMEFGMWRWICYPILWVLNVFNDLIPNYGVAIILLTILVRLVFWPLTHKSTVGMKKMQEIQPLMKKLQEQYKDNPQRLQQETFALYREHKVNPMSSCLPMLIQIPVFIALFNVLRSAVELRYAPFLWIGDLSQPEGLFSSWFPFGGLNILPILMALTMGLQSALTPSAGDKNQQKMMTVFMPVMMLVMFYSFPSALSLYWTLSQAVSIVQMWLIKRATEAQRAAAGGVEVLDPIETRQMRRHS